MIQLSIMETWKIYAIISMFFAGLTSILAKFGLKNINSDLALGIRIAAIFVLVSSFIVATNKLRDIGQITRFQFVLLLLSGLTTTLSWVFYYRAMKDGLVSYVAAIDKGSIVITILLSFLLLNEPITPKILMGGALIVTGLLVLIW
jgi:bacterial/archaeal transporter family protein